MQKTLPTLLSQDTKYEYEIIMVDSGSTDGAVEYAENLKKVKIVKIQQENFNYANAFNTGAKETKGEILIRLSGDCIPVGKIWINDFVNSFLDEKVGGAYGKYIITGRKGYTYPDFWPQESFPKVLTRYSVRPTFFMGGNIFRIQFGNPKARKEVFNFAGGYCAVRRNIWEKRPFSEELLGGEDAEFSLYLQAHGYDVVCNPEVQVIHEHEIKKSRYKRHIFDKGQWIFNWVVAKMWIRRLFSSRD